MHILIASKVMTKICARSGDSCSYARWDGNKHSYRRTILVSKTYFLKLLGALPVLYSYSPADARTYIRSTQWTFFTEISNPRQIDQPTNQELNNLFKIPFHNKVIGYSVFLCGLGIWNWKHYQEQTVVWEDNHFWRNNWNNGSYKSTELTCCS